METAGRREDFGGTICLDEKKMLLVIIGDDCFNSEQMLIETMDFHRNPQGFVGKANHFM